MIKKLEPIKESSEDFEAIEKEISDLFRSEIYLPILKDLDLDSSVLKNAPYDLAGAIASGRVTFYRGQFRGRFSAAVSRELRGLGAKWDRKQGCWKVPLSALPDHILDAIDRSESKFQRLLKKLDQKLSDLLPEKIADKLKLSDLFSTVLWRVEKAIQKSVKNITIVPTLDDDMKKKISVEYEKNMQKYIKDWTEKEIVSLRKQIKKSVLAGERYESLIQTIKKSYGVSEGKAKFLARQETSLMSTKFRESRYLSAGVEEYEWRCVVGSPKHPVRPEHKALEGKIFKWNNPPITSPEGRRNNPGEDFNCRCFAVPIVRFK